MDAIRAVIPPAVKAPLRGVRDSCATMLQAMQVVNRDRVRPALRVLSCKWQFCKCYVANGCRVKTILTLPHKPGPDSVLYKICHRLGVRMVDTAGIKADLAIHWEDCTVRQREATLDRLSVTQPVLNSRCLDISKRKVEAVHQAVFGYGLAVNPREFTGRCVKKSNENALHDGKIIQGPVAQVEEQCVYQRVVNNSRDGKFVEDIRVPVFGKAIPFCYRKFRPIGWRFSNQNNSAELCEVAEVLSAQEVDLLLRFCHEMGLDFGEVDVLRDVDDGKVYIIDVNNTPFGPPNHLSGIDVQQALKKLSAAFQSEFILTGRSILARSTT